MPEAAGLQTFLKTEQGRRDRIEERSARIPTPRGGRPKPISNDPRRTQRIRPAARCPPTEPFRAGIRIECALPSRIRAQSPTQIASSAPCVCGGWFAPKSLPLERRRHAKIRSRQAKIVPPGPTLQSTTPLLAQPVSRNAQHAVERLGHRPVSSPALPRHERGATTNPSR